MTKYLCEMPVGNECLKWVEFNQFSGGFITPEIVGMVISYAFILNLVVFGFKTMRRQL